MVILLGFGPGDGGSTPLGTTNKLFFRYFMKKLLLIGINTRSVLNSALKLNYEIYSASYFSTSDTPNIKNQKIILNENDGESCGIFDSEFSSDTLLEISKDYIDEVDYIIPLSGISPSDFKPKDQKKILGNINIKNIENKFKFYKKIKDEFITPKTFYITDIHEAYEINENYPDTQFILKPLQGSGGYNINLLNNNPDIELNDMKFIMQEYIKGINLSSSTLATKNNVKTITNSRLLTMNDTEKNNSFKYIGNIVPLTDKSIMSNIAEIDKINHKLNETSQNLSQKFNLIGSNGIDYILNEKGLYVIEINPRIQGTFECIEKSFGINMLEAHIKACQGKIIKIPQPKYYSYKKIIYSPTKMKYAPIDANNIYDLPHIGSITEKEEPLLTIIDKSKSFEEVYEKIEFTSKIVNESSKEYRLDKE